ncbi:MAG: pyridoxamine 5'-phosphate oxidase family protein [Bryobacteraceae bacterium]
MSTREENIHRLGELIRGIPIAMLTTVDDKGHLHSRPMVVANREFRGDLWFFTSIASHKAEEVRRESHVSASFVSREDDRYVSVSGRAELVADREKAQELWTGFHEPLFPKGVDDPDLGLLRVRVEKAEYWTSSGRVAGLGGFTEALHRGGRLEVHEHDTMELVR